MDKAELERCIEAGNFSENNGKVLRTVNILAGKDIRLTSLRYALPEIGEGELAESLYYLQDAGYLKARDIRTKKGTDVSEADDQSTEVRITGKGMELLKGFDSNPAVQI